MVRLAASPCVLNRRNVQGGCVAGDTEDLRPGAAQHPAIGRWLTSDARSTGRDSFSILRWQRPVV